MIDRHRIIPPIYFFAALLAEAGLHFYLAIEVLVPSPFNLISAVFVALGLGTALWAAGLFGTAAAFLPIPLFVRQIRRKFVLEEERFLEGLFGQQYLEYKLRVKRWI